MLLDSDGAVSTSYAPAGVLPDLARDQIAIASNLIIDATGRMSFFSLLDTTSFDAKLLTLRERLEQLLAEVSKAEQN